MLRPAVRTPLVAPAALLLAGSLAVLAPPPAHAAPQSLTVRVGQDLSPGRGRAAELMRFLPSSIDVHQGDSLRFVGSFHTATALPAGTSVNTWIANNARRFGQRYFFLARDDRVRTQFNPNVIYPQGCTNGSCPYDGTRLVNSGLLGLVVRSATLQVDVPAGTAFWVICLLHPQMRLLVHVVSDTTATPSQSSLDAQARNQTATANAQAADLWNALQRPHSTRRSNGTRAWTAFAGFDWRGLELFGMFPQTLRIRRGDVVQWHFTQLQYEPHSVVFPAATAQRISDGPPPMCERPNGTDVPARPDFTCPPGSQGPVEIELDPRVLRGGGNGMVTSTRDYENSGARGGFDLPNARTYQLRFPFRSGRSGFGYACGVHGTMMSGRVVVS